MQKAVFIILASSILSASEFAGGYVGGLFNVQKFNSESKYTAQNYGKISNSSTKPSISSFAGYGSCDLLKGMYFSAEAKLGYDARSGSNTNSLTLKNKPGISLGGFARVGTIINKNSLPYLLIGYESFSASTNLKSNHGSKIISLKNKGIAMGGGVDYLLNNKWFLRFDYKHNFNSSKSFQGNVNGTNITAKVKTSSDTVGLGGGYKF
jgi:opacity protein-like surface antigen